jgi:Zn-dependent peptidase ImmA (M78 family)
MSAYKALESDATLASKDNIQSYAEEMAKKLNYKFNNLDEIINNLNIELDFVNPLEEDDDFNGSIYINKETKNINIHLSNLTGELRNNFTIAHELGHLYLHSRDIDKIEIIFNRFGSGRLEWEANWFAAAFLMPAELFKDKYQEYNSDTSDLSLYFNVSESAIKVRKKDLGL